jgi:hypothetical protein
MIFVCAMLMNIVMVYVAEVSRTLRGWQCGGEGGHEYVTEDVQSVLSNLRFSVKAPGRWWRRRRQLRLKRGWLRVVAGGRGRGRGRGRGLEGKSDHVVRVTTAAAAVRKKKRKRFVGEGDFPVRGDVSFMTACRSLILLFFYNACAITLLASAKSWRQDGARRISFLPGNTCEFSLTVRYQLLAVGGGEDE